MIRKTQIGWVNLGGGSRRCKSTRDKGPWFLIKDQVKNHQLNYKALEKIQEPLEPI